MPVVFNAIACTLPLLAAELEVAGLLMARILRNHIQCPACGAQYSVIVSRADEPELEAIVGELRSQVTASCGQHPVMIQQQ